MLKVGYDHFEITKRPPEVAICDKKYAFNIHTPYYDLDLNHDGNPEQIVFVKKDGEDWIEIFEQKNKESRKIFGYRFETKGFDSELYRIEFKKLSPKTYVILMYYFEGISRYIEMQSTARLYVGTIDNDDLKTISVFKGPSFFEEKKFIYFGRKKKSFFAIFF